MSEDPTMPFDTSKAPKHVAIIMDGNNRWAKRKLLPGVAGYKAGVEAVRRIVKACGDFGVEVLTLFAFSSENWLRPKDEVNALMDIFLSALQKEVKKLHKNNIRLRFIGDRSRFSTQLQHYMKEAEQATAANNKTTLVIAVSYGGRWDVAQAAQRIAQDVKKDLISTEMVDEQLIGRYMSISDLPEPDLLIRTAGERRISNFLLWQLAYTEFYFSDLYWPEFDQAAFYEALLCFAQRERRFGGRK